MDVIEYKRGTKLNGGIVISEATGEKIYIAVTAATSRDFKTLKGAQRFMERKGYTITKGGD